MKKSAAFTISLSLLVVAALAAILALSHGRSITMTFLKYSPSPAGAFVRVHNGTTKKMVCLAENADPAEHGKPLLTLKQGSPIGTPGAIRIWTGTIWEVKSSKAISVIVSSTGPAITGSVVQFVN